MSGAAPHVSLLIEAANEVKALVELDPEAQRVGSDLWTALHRLDVALHPESVGAPPWPVQLAVVEGVVFFEHDVHARVESLDGVNAWFFPAPDAKIGDRVRVTVEAIDARCERIAPRCDECRSRWASKMEPIACEAHRETGARL